MTPIKLLRCPPYSGDCMGVNINASLQKNKLYRRFPVGTRRKSVGFIQHNLNCLFVFMLLFGSLFDAGRESRRCGICCVFALAAVWQAKRAMRRTIRPSEKADSAFFRRPLP